MNKMTRAIVVMTTSGMILGGCGGDGSASTEVGAKAPKPSLVHYAYGLDVTFSDKMPGFLPKPGDDWPAGTALGLGNDVTRVKIDLGDGTSRTFAPDSSGGFKFTHQYEHAGTYDVTMTVSGPGGAASMKRTLAVREHVPGALNDTGVSWCAGYLQRYLSCDADLGTWSAWVQDARQGRDALATDGDLDKAGFGRLGFDFTKLDHAGRSLPPEATIWRCLRDNVTGLVWEVKTSDGGLHDVSRNFHWYLSDNTINGGYAGRVHRNSTETYMEEVNSTGWCGWNDWRLPTFQELVGLANFGKGPDFDNLVWQLAGGSLNLGEKAAKGFWTSQTQPTSPGWAYTVSGYGVMGSGPKSMEIEKPAEIGIILVRNDR